jgi:hypothetical protein
MTAAMAQQGLSGFFFVILKADREYELMMYSSLK